MQSQSPSSPPSRHPDSPKRVRPLWIGLVLGYALVVAQPNLPSLEALTDYRPKVPLRVYTADHVLIGEFGEERRSVVRLQDIPANMKNAVLAIEDARFYQHGGIDVLGLLRAAGADILH